MIRTTNRKKMIDNLRSDSLSAKRMSKGFKLMSNDYSQILDVTGEIVGSILAGRDVSDDFIAKCIKSTYAALSACVAPAPAVEPKPELVPAVPIKKSVFPDYIVCLEDGKKLKMLKKHLAVLGMTPEQYRAKWRLPADYPLVAPNYAEKRSVLAKKIGLGKKRAEPEGVVVAEKPKRKKAAQHVAI